VITELSKDQAARVRRARKVLAADTTAGPQDTAGRISDLAARTGQLSFWLGDMIALIDQLTRQQDG
jgi:hypothetical protein